MSRPTVLAIAVIVLLAVGACGAGPATTGAPAPASPSDGPAAVTNPPAASGSAPAGDATCEPTTDAGTVAAAMSERAFSPGQITAKVGDVIAWTNNDAVTHTATLKDDPACTTANLAGGATGALRFSAAGTYPFFCKIHADMTGTIEVTS